MNNRISAMFGRPQHHANDNNTNRPPHGLRALQSIFFIFNYLTNFPQPRRAVLVVPKTQEDSKYVVCRGLYEELQHFYLNWKQFL